MSLKCLVCSVFFAIGIQTYGTHIKGGEITYKTISNQFLTYEFTLIMYHDRQSPVRSGDGIINFGDGREVQIDLAAASIKDGVYIGHNQEIELIKITIVHTYMVPGTYSVNYIEPNRNDEMVNINLGNYQQLPFFLESQLVIDPAIGVNSSPVFSTFPLDFGFVGKTFTHNTWASDPDGDSLTYRLVTPRTDGGTTVTNYLNPNNSEFYMSPLDWGLANESMDGPANFNINPFTGDLTWDAPGNLLSNSQGKFSEYNVALVVEEWREIDGSWRRIGHVTRDFTTIVNPDEIGRPDFELPEHKTLISTEVVEESIVFQDPDGDPIKVEYFGELFELGNSPMEVRPKAGNFESEPLTLSFKWTPLSEHNRARPYYIHLKVTDKPLDSEIPPAVTYKTWIITSSASSEILIPEVITDLNEKKPEGKIKFFPNPVERILKWDLIDREGYKLIIYNSIGQRTISLDLSSTNMKELDVSRLSAGLYMIQVYNEKNSYNSAFVKL